MRTTVIILRLSDNTSYFHHVSFFWEFNIRVLFLHYFPFSFHHLFVSYLPLLLFKYVSPFCCYCCVCVYMHVCVYMFAHISQRFVQTCEKRFPDMTEKSYTWPYFLGCDHMYSTYVRSIHTEFHRRWDKDSRNPTLSWEAISNCWLLGEGISIFCKEMVPGRLFMF